MLIYSIVHWVVSAFALLITAYLVPGFKVKSFGSALLAAFVIGIANVLVRPFLVFITLPFSILTFGLFLFVVNAMVLKMCAAILRDFTIKSWGAAIMGGIILAVVGTALHVLLI